MGITGVGKSSFIKTQENNNKVVAEDMENQRAEITSRLTLMEQERRRLDVDIAGKSRESDKRIQELAQQTRTSKLRAVAAGAAKRLGFLGPAVLALMGEPVSGATMMIQAFESLQTSGRISINHHWLWLRSLASIKTTPR